MDPIDRDGNRVPYDAQQSSPKADARPTPQLGTLHPSGLNRQQRRPKAVRERARKKAIDAEEAKKTKAREAWSPPSTDLGDPGDV